MEDAAVAESAGLLAVGELDQTGGVCAGAVGIDGEGDAFLPSDAVTVAGGYVPYAPGDTLQDLFPFTIWRFAIYYSGTLGNAAQLAEGEGFQSAILFHTIPPLRYLSQRRNSLYPAATTMAMSTRLPRYRRSFCHHDSGLATSCILFSVRRLNSESVCCICS